MLSEIVTQNIEKFALTIMKGQDTIFHKWSVKASTPGHRNKILIVSFYRDTMYEAL